jgi:hypothetical protein
MRHVIVSAVLALPAAALAQSAAPDGEAVYRQHCAGCHNGTMPRMPSRDALKRLTPEHVETALSSFNMRRQGAALTLPERRAVAEYVTGSAAGSYRAPLEVIPKSAYCAAPSTTSDLLAGAAWNGFGGDARNTRFAPAAVRRMSDAFHSVRGLSLTVIFLVGAHTWAIRHVPFSLASFNPQWTLMSSAFEPHTPVVTHAVPDGYLADFQPVGMRPASAAGLGTVLPPIIRKQQRFCGPRAG